MSFPVSLPRWRIERCGGNPSRAKQQLRYSHYCKLIMCAGGEISRRARRNFSSIEFNSMCFIFLSLKSSSGCWIHFNCFCERGPAWLTFDTREGFTGTFWLLTPLYRNSQTIEDALQNVLTQLFIAFHRTSPWFQSKGFIDIQSAPRRTLAGGLNSILKVQNVDSCFSDLSVNKRTQKQHQPADKSKAVKSKCRNYEMHIAKVKESKNISKKWGWIRKN